MVENPLAKAGNAEALGLIPQLGRSPGEGNGNPLQYSCLENPMDRGTQQGYSPCGNQESVTTELHNNIKNNLSTKTRRVLACKEQKKL